MMSVREVPWHGLGKVLDKEPANIDEAIVAAGLEWEVAQEPIYIPGAPVLNENGVEQSYVEVPAALANVRQDTRDVLGVVTKHYKVIQNREAFDFLDSLIGSDMHFETAGSIFGGKRVWVLARIPEWIEVGGDDVSQYVFITNSHDGKAAVIAAVTPIRIVCNNTLTWALNTVKRSVTIRHKGEDMAAKLYEARKVLDLTIDYNKQFKELGDKLAQERMTTGQFEKIVNTLVPIDEDTMGKKSITMASNARGNMIDFWNGKGDDGDTRGNAPGTKWVAVNAIAEYSDWGRKMTSRGNQVARSFEDTTIKQQALELVLSA
jgi:phage/plasmid-like protein (TIGR03299 family)